MRAREFTINIPINIKLGDDDEPEVTSPDTTNIVRDVAVVQHQEPASDTSPEDDEEMGVMVPPLQQQIELQKAALGKESEVIDDLTDEDEVDQEEDEEDESERFVDLSSFWNQKPVGN